MENRKRFITIFPHCFNFHLTKDVGMIPYALYKYYDYDATVACYNNDNYSFLLDEVKGLKIVFLKKYFSNDILNILFFILLNYRKYDILNLFHFNRSRFLIMILFKVLNFRRRTFVYLKLDVNENFLKINFKKYFKYLLSFDLLSVESKTAYEKILENKKIKNLVLIKNGFIFKQDDRLDVESSKENFFLNVGRISDPIKSTKSILDAYLLYYSITEKPWKLIFVGKVEGDFKKKLAIFFKKNNFLKEFIIFTGEISEKNHLESYYKKAKVYIQASKSEGFPLVFAEAIKNNCIIITSDILCANDVTKNGKFGYQFEKENIEMLSHLMWKISNNYDCSFMSSESYIDFKSSFDWKNIISVLDERIQLKFTR